MHSRPGTDEAHRYLWTMTGTTLELTHNYDTEKDEAFKYHPGNQARFPPTVFLRCLRSERLTMRRGWRLWKSEEERRPGVRRTLPSRGAAPG